MYKENIMKKSFLLSFLLVFVLTASVSNTWADNSKIAVVSEGNTADSVVCAVAARGPYFLIFDGKGKFIEALDNPYQNAGGGASGLVVDYLSDKGITTIIAGNFGNKMIATMTARRIHYFKFQGSAVNAVKKVIQ